MQRSMVLLVLLGSVLTAALVACAPVPGLGPVFGPDSGMALFFLAAIGLAAYGITRRQQRKPDWGRRAESGHDRTGEPAMQILRERYAKGEISRSEYLQLLDDLTIADASRTAGSAK
jgi:uncharacterized membrane protein